MNIKTILMVAYALSATLFLLLLATGGLVGGGSPSLPLLTLLFIAEFGFFVAGGGAIVAMRGVKGERLEKNRLAVAGGLAFACLVFLGLGVMLWRGYVAAGGGG